MFRLFPAFADILITSALPSIYCETPHLIDNNSWDFLKHIFLLGSFYKCFEHWIHLWRSTHLVRADILQNKESTLNVEHSYSLHQRDINFQKYSTSPVALNTEVPFHVNNLCIHQIYWSSYRSGGKRAESFRGKNRVAHRACLIVIIEKSVLNWYTGMISSTQWVTRFYKKSQS